MAQQNIVLTLTQLRCLAQSESGSGSEPYLWTTFFAFGGEPLPFQTGNLSMITPAYDAFRAEFPNGMKAGSVANVPSFVASAHFKMDLDTAPQPKMVGCIAVLMEEDSTPQSSIVSGRIAYSKEIEAQLDALFDKRLQAGDFGPVTDAEINTIRSKVKAKVESAVSSDQFLGGFFTDQDDNIGFTYASFKYPVPQDSEDPKIEFQYFDFPEITSGSSNRFVLTGRLSIEAIPADPVVLCKAQRDALKANADQIHGLQVRKTLLQEQLHHAPPGQKADIIHAIEETSEAITRAESHTPELQAALDACLPNVVEVDVNQPNEVHPA
jgi:hypothetical protein